MPHLLRAPLAASLTLALAGCFVEGPHSRDEHRTVDAIRQEHRWASDQIGRRLPAEELSRVRAGEQQPARDARRRLQRLLDAVDRLSWMREATPRGLWASAEDTPDIDELAFRYDRAGKLRREALGEADEIAEALATSPAPGALAFADLRKALLTLQRSEAGEDRIQGELGQLARKEPALAQAVRRFAPQPPASPRPFVAASIAWLRGHPEDRAQLDQLPRELSPDVQRIRTALAEEPPRPPMPAPPAEPVKPVPQEPSPDERGAVRERADEAQREVADEQQRAGAAQPKGLLELQGDAKQMVQSRGLPRAIAARASGMIGLRYEEPRPCASGKGNCPTLVDYLFKANGTFSHEEVVGPAPKAPPQKPQDDMPGDD